MYIPYGEKEIAHLKKRDKKLGGIIDTIGKVHRKIYPDLFASLVRTIIGQQISSEAQRTVWKRMQTMLGTVTPETVADTSVETLQSAGMTHKKAGCIKNLAEKITSGDFDIKRLEQASDEDAIKMLSALDGIGKWTAEMVLLFTLLRPDILSEGDLGILRGMRMVYRKKDINKNQFACIKKRLSPYGSIASLYFWAVAGGAIPELTDPAAGKKKTPARKKTKAKKMKTAETIYTTTYKSPLGMMTLAASGGALIGLWFDGQKFDKSTMPEKTEEKDLPIFKDTKRWLDIYFAGHQPDFTPKLDMQGTAFRKKVWQALLAIPYGKVTTYGELAKKLSKGKQNSARAIGGAVGHNPLTLIIPCHRVIGAGNNLTGYAGGIKRKIALLKLEGVKTDDFIYRP